MTRTKRRSRKFEAAATRDGSRSGLRAAPARSGNPFTVTMRFADGRGALTDGCDFRVRGSFDPARKNAGDPNLECGGRAKRRHRFSSTLFVEELQKRRGAPLPAALQIPLVRIAPVKDTALASDFKTSKLQVRP